MTQYYFFNLLTINSIFHFIFPFCIGWLLNHKWRFGILILIAFELFENLSGITLSIANWDIFSPEPLVNIMTDLAIGTTALYVAPKLRKKLESTGHLHTKPI